MPNNPVRGFQSRFMQKPSGVVIMDQFLCGRITRFRPVGALHSQMGLRTGFFGGNVDIGQIPNAAIKEVRSIHNQEGILWVLPYTPGSPGWKVFHDLPLMKMNELERQVDAMTIKVSTAIQAAQDIHSPEQLRQLLFNVYDMFESWKKDVMTPDKLGLVTPEAARKESGPHA